MAEEIVLQKYPNRFVNKIQFTMVMHMIFLSGLQMSKTMRFILQMENAIANLLHDKMTQCRYQTPIKTFELFGKLEPTYEVDILKDGKAALEKANADMGEKTERNFFD